MHPYREVANQKWAHRVAWFSLLRRVRVLQPTASCAMQSAKQSVAQQPSRICLCRRHKCFLRAGPLNAHVLDCQSVVARTYQWNPHRWCAATMALLLRGSFLMAKSVGLPRMRAFWREHPTINLVGWNACRCAIPQHEQKWERSVLRQVLVRRQVDVPTAHAPKMHLHLRLQRQVPQTEWCE
ncbi:unannotated protein [freshwater metagenome]|uniref:Unannotated protein n=1 Tax=freshwater metagenome TaxID=449393 RepID=A0A6J6EPM6_9ZZZZ